MAANEWIILVGALAAGIAVTAVSFALAHRVRGESRDKGLGRIFDTYPTSRLPTDASQCRMKSMIIARKLGLAIPGPFGLRLYVSGEGLVFQYQPLGWKLIDFEDTPRLAVVPWARIAVQGRDRWMPVFKNFAIQCGDVAVDLSIWVPFRNSRIEEAKALADQGDG